MKNREQYDKIDAYLQDELPPSEQQAFEQALQTDPQLAEQVRLQREILEALQDKPALAFYDRLRAASAGEDRDRTGQKGRIIPFRRWLAVAASVVLLAGVALTIYANRSYSNERLADAIYEETEPPGLQRNGSSTPLRPLQEAQKALQEGRWEDAIRLAAAPELYSESPDSTEARFIAACAFLQLGDTREALRALNLVTRSASVWKQRAEYLRVGTSLQAGNTEEAKEYLQAILDDPRHDYYQQAENIFSRLHSPLRRLTFN